MESQRVSDNRGNLVIVFGASGRIGRALLERIALCGFDIIATHHSDSGGAMLQRWVKTSDVGRHTKILYADAANSDSIKSVFGAASSLEPTATYVVNCIGVTGDKGMEDFSDQDAMRVLDVNLLGSLFILREASGAAGRLALRSVVLIGSTAGVKAVASSPAYVAAKAGLSQLAAIYAKALAPTVRVNCVALGIIGLESHPGRARVVCESAIPLKRYGTAEEAAEVIEFVLLRPGYITGQTVVMDGGLVL